MNDMQLKAAIWSLFTSTEFFEAAARECEDTMRWFGTLAISQGVANFGRNNQIFDTFKRRAKDFRRGAELARYGDYRLIWSTAGSIRGDARGMIEQPLHSWMTKAEYEEFDDVRISRLVTYGGLIECALNNAIGGAESFYNPHSDYPERRNDDDGFPEDRIIEMYNGYLDSLKGSLICKIPDPIPVYVIDNSTTCQTGDEVPWTGVWCTSTVSASFGLTFAIKGFRMQPAYQVTKTAEELKAEGVLLPYPETVAVPAIWHPVLPSRQPATDHNEIWAKAGDPCPKSGIWLPTDPGAMQRTFQAGETMADLGSAFGFTVWRWIADR